jgi:hypothetical protein
VELVAHNVEASPDTLVSSKYNEVPVVITSTVPPTGTVTDVMMDRYVDPSANLNSTVAL